MKTKTQNNDLGGLTPLTKEDGKYYNMYIPVRPGNAGKDKEGNPCPKNP